MGYRKSRGVIIVNKTDALYMYRIFSNLIENHSRDPNLEIILAKDYQYSMKYAKTYLKDAFPQAHPVIFDSPLREEYIEFLKKINYDMDNVSEWLV
jgi:hypothetical protein